MQTRGCQACCYYSPSAMVGEEVDTIDYWVTKSFVRIVDAHLCTETPPLALIATSCHLLEMLQVVFDAVVAVLRRDSVHTLLTHLLLLGVVRICLSCVDHLEGKFVELIEVIGRMGDPVAMDVKQRKVLEDSLLEFGL